MAKLTTAERNALPDSDFAGPNRSYPVENASHARAALSMGAKYAFPFVAIPHQVQSFLEVFWNRKVLKVIPPPGQTASHRGFSDDKWPQGVQWQLSLKI